MTTATINLITIVVTVAKEEICSSDANDINLSISFLVRSKYSQW